MPTQADINNAIAAMSGGITNYDIAPFGKLVFDGAGDYYLTYSATKPKSILVISQYNDAALLYYNPGGNTIFSGVGIVLIEGFRSVPPVEGPPVQAINGNVRTLGIVNGVVDTAPASFSISPTNLANIRIRLATGGRIYIKE